MDYLAYDNDMGGYIQIPFDIIPIHYIHDVELLYDEYIRGVIGISVHVFGDWLYRFDKDEALRMFDRIMDYFTEEEG